ncbi:hypothetical protein A9P79_01245 [Cupriavidus taiwanensis]|nr:hypothetical protein A9P79_01245 [Cupriavidus taiwanensis]
MHRALAGARVRRVEIRNFKSIQSLDLDFSAEGAASEGRAAATVLLGENATGKSSVLQAIALVLMDGDLRKKLIPYPRVLVRAASHGELSAVASDVLSSIKLTLDIGETRILSIKSNGEWSDDVGAVPMMLAYGAHRMFGTEAAAPRTYRREASIRSLFHRNQPIAHSAQWLQTIDRSTFEAVARAMREILALGPKDGIRREESGKIFVSAHGRDMPLERLSDGYRALSALVLDIMRNMLRLWRNLEDAQGIVLIDEIEVHLHPRWKMQVVGALRRAMPQIQFMFTTHDPLCLRGMLGDEVHVLVRDESAQVQEMTGLPDVRGMRAEQLLTSEFFGLSSTSDPEADQARDRLALSGGREADSSPSRSFVSDSAVFTMIGDTPARQVVNEALRRRIVEQLQSSTLDRSQVRRDAVELVLARLRATDEGAQ